MSRLFILIFFLFSGVSSQAESFSNFIDSIGTRSEYTNEGLLHGINWNRWLYFGKPTKALRAIDERADRSQADAEELLIKLTAILTDQSPAGDYIVELYQSLLQKAQAERPMSLFTLKSVLEKLNWQRVGPSGSLIVAFDEIDRSILKFVVNELVLEKDSNLVKDESELALTLLGIHLLDGSERSLNVITQISAQFIKFADQDLILNQTDRLFQLMSMELYYDGEKKKLNAHGEQLNRLRTNSLRGLSLSQAKLVAAEHIRSFRLSANPEDDFFKYLKLKPDVDFLLTLNEPAILSSLAINLEKIIKLLESLDRNVSAGLRSAVTTKVIHSVANPSSSIGQLATNYSAGAIGASDVTRAIKNLEIRSRVQSDAQEQIEYLKSICATAVNRSDGAVIEACTEDLIPKLLELHAAPGPWDIKRLLSAGISAIFMSTIDHNQGHGLRYSALCNEDSVESQHESVKVLLMSIENQSVKIARHQSRSFDGLGRGQIKYFKFLDCTKPEVSVLVTANNKTHLSWNENSVGDLFFVDIETVGTCIGEFENELQTPGSNDQWDPARVSYKSYKEFIENRVKKLLVFDSESHQAETMTEPLTLEERSFREVAKRVHVVTERFEKAVADSGLMVAEYEGLNMPEAAAEFCYQKSKNKVSCGVESGEATCKANSKFSIQLKLSDLR